MTTPCPRCGHDNANDALLCGTCRAYLGWTRRGGQAATAPGGAPGPDEPDEAPTTTATPAEAPPGTSPPATATPAGAGAPPTRVVAPPTPIAVPLDRSAAPRAVQVPATGATPRPVRSTRPVPPSASGSPAPPAARPTSADVPVVAPATPPRAAAGAGAVGTGTTPAAQPGAPAGRSAWTPSAPAPAPAAPPPRGAPSGGPAAGGPAPVQVVLGPSTPRPARPDARTAPPRTIGVRVAAGPARIDPQRPAGSDVATPARTSGFEALRPDAAADEPGAGRVPGTGGARPARPSAAVPAFEEAVRCPTCGRALPASRRFCRCGATLTPAPRPLEDDAPPAVPWYRRAAGSATSFRRRLRAANHGVRVPFDRARAAQVHVARATAALAAVGLAGVVVLPQASDVRARVTSVVQQADPRGYTRVAGVTATTDPPPVADPSTAPVDPATAAADPAAPAAEPAVDLVFGAQNAVDGATGRAWSAPWTAPVDAGPPCQRPGGAPALVLTLPRATDVDRVGLVVGLPESAPDRARQAVPALVDVTWLPSGRCTTLELTDATTLQTQDVDVRGSTSARVVVVDVHLPQDPPADLRVAVAEVVVMAHGRLAVG